VHPDSAGLTAAESTGGGSLKRMPQKNGKKKTKKNSSLRPGSEAVPKTGGLGRKRGPASGSEAEQVGASLNRNCVVI